VETLNIFRTSDNKQTVPAGTTLFERGDDAQVMYAVLEGRLSVEVDGKVVDEVEPGGIVGEMALVRSGTPRSATVRATEDSIVVPVDEDEFLGHVHRTPFFALQVLRIVAERLRRTNELI
jgi:CRP-like cAMP-binding protein